MENNINLLSFFRKQFHWLKGSMDNLPGGASSKKLTALGSFIVSTIITLVWVIWAFIHDNWDLLLGVLPMWLTAATGALIINSQEKKKGVATSKEDLETEKINNDGL